MRRRRAGFGGTFTALMVAAAALGAVPCTIRAEDARKSAAVEQARAAARRGLAFTEKDAADWRETKKCASCHQGIMTAWTFVEARERGYPVRAELLANTFAWCRERFTAIDQPRSADPNSRAISTAALMFGLMALTNPGQTSLAPEELTRLGTHFVNTQEPNGFWTWSVVPPGNRPPPVSESDEVATLMAYLCLEGGLSTDRRQTSPAAASREKAAAWLASTPHGDSTQSAALRLYASVRDGAPKEQQEAAIADLLARQNADGGWSQTRDRSSDGFATGQVLYFLHLSGLAANRAEMKRGIAFLVADQREDGSWKVIPRAQPGAQPFTHPEPIVSFGTAWATMALMRLVPPGE
jgi:hypothetical protein